MAYALFSRRNNKKRRAQKNSLKFQHESKCIADNCQNPVLAGRKRCSYHLKLKRQDNIKMKERKAYISCTLRARGLLGLSNNPLFNTSRFFVAQYKLARRFYKQKLKSSSKPLVSSNKDLYRRNI